MIIEKWREGELSGQNCAMIHALTAAHPALIIGADMIKPVVGRQLEGGEYDDGMGLHFVRPTI